jgi:hypothetical protein
VLLYRPPNDPPKLLVRPLPCFATLELFCPLATCGS